MSHVTKCFDEKMETKSVCTRYLSSNMFGLQCFNLSIMSKKRRQHGKHRSRQPEVHSHGQADRQRPEVAGWPVLLLMIAVVAGIVSAAHWPALSARALCFDDNEYMVENRLVRNPGWASAGRFLSEVSEPSTVQGYYQPLNMISLMLDYAMGGRPDNLRPFHRTSLILHVANTATIILLLYLIFGKPWPAALAGLLFGVHPLTIEPLPWIGERKTLLAAFFALWSLIFYVRFAKSKGKINYAACLLAYVLALMSKPTSTPLPLAMLLLDHWPLGRLNKRAIVEKIPLFIISFLSAGITYYSQRWTAGAQMPHEFPLWRVPLVLCHNIIFYLYKIIWPTNLTPHYPFPDPVSLSNGMVAAGVVGTVVLIAVLLISWRRTRVFVTGWLIFFMMIFPTMQAWNSTKSSRSLFSSSSRS